MANFPSFTFTAAGRAAITRSLSGKNVDRLIITKCVLGDGVYSGDIDSLKYVTSPKMTVTVSEYTDNGDGTSVTRFVYDNASLDVGFSHREMGIYAKNGDSGAELLLCYSNAGDQYSYIKAGAVDSVTKQRKATIPPQTFKFVLATGGSGSVNAVIDPKGYVDVEMLKEHNNDPTAHPDKLVNLTTNGNSLRAVKGNGTNVDVVVPYAVGTTTLKLQSNELTLDMGNGTQTNINIGLSPKNYSGSGFNYNFYDGKGNYADVYADEYYGTFRGKAMVGGIALTADLNTPYTDTYSKKLECTNNGTANNLPYKWNFITTFKNTVDIAQLAIPMSSTARISLRCMPNQSNNTLVGDWLEIPYLRDIQPIAAAEVAKVVNGAPATLDTLNELANALGNDPNFATTVTKMISQKADKTAVDNIVNVMYPVGIIVEFAADVDPNTTWVGTTWERMSSGRVLVSAGQYNETNRGHIYALGETGGEAQHTLTTAEMPSHSHSGTTDTNGNHTHTLHKGNSGSGGAYFSQGQVYGADSGTVTPPEIAGNHTHAITVSNTGGGLAHNNMQPYEVVNRWKRTA